MAQRERLGMFVVEKREEEAERRKRKEEALARLMIISSLFPHLISLILWLGYFNSTHILIIYTIICQEF
jgi:hypothetical protein